MSNDKHLNYYIDILGSTLKEAVLGNVSLQANAKISEEILQELQQENKFLKEKIEKINSEGLEAQQAKDKAKNDEIEALKNTLNIHQNNISELQAEKNRLNQNLSEYENAKHQLNHLETFKNELIKAQQILKEKDELIDKLNNDIQNLKLSPVKKNDDKKKSLKVDLKQEVVQQSSDEVSKDGGSF